MTSSNGPSRSTPPDPGAAAWAHNRWPTIGLVTGAGIGAALWMLFALSWYLGLAAVVAGALAGIIAGALAAMAVHGRA